MSTYKSRVLLAFFMGSLPQVNTSRWICKEETKYHICGQHDTSGLCYRNDRNVSLPCYPKCHNVKAQIYITDCMNSCKGYLETYCSNSATSSTEPPESEFTVRTSANTTVSSVHLTTLSVRPNNNTGISSENHLFHLLWLLLLVLLLLIVIGLVIWIKCTKKGKAWFRKFRNRRRPNHSQNNKPVSPSESGYSSIDMGILTANDEGIEGQPEPHQELTAENRIPYMTPAQDGQVSELTQVSTEDNRDQEPAERQSCLATPVDEVEGQVPAHHGRDETEEIPEQAESDPLIN